MANIQTIKLSEAQYSALECAGVFEPDEAFVDALWLDEDILRLSVTGSNAKAAMAISANTQQPVWRALTELSNGEDFIAQQRKGDETGRLAGRASRSLGTLASKVLNMKFETPKGDSQ